MLKIIDLDHISKDKDREAYVFTLTVGGDKIGMTEEELADLIRSKAGAPKGAKKAARKVQGAAEAASDTAEGESQSEAEGDKPAWPSGRPLDGETGTTLS